MSINNSVFFGRATDNLESSWPHVPGILLVTYFLVVTLLYF